jgi:hypothetical protein
MVTTLNIFTQNKVSLSYNFTGTAVVGVAVAICFTQKGTSHSHRLYD